MFAHVRRHFVVFVYYINSRMLLTSLHVGVLSATYMALGIGYCLYNDEEWLPHWVAIVLELNVRALIHTQNG